MGANFCNFGGEGIIMRKDVLEEIDMLEKFDNMTTWTEFEEILTAAVAAGYPGLINADAEGTVISPGPYIAGSDKLEEAYWVDVAGDGNGQIYIDQADGKVKCYYMNEDYKNNLIRIGDWYTKGLVYKDASTAEEYADQQIKNGVGTAMVKTLEYGWAGSLPAACGCEMAVKFTGAMNLLGTGAFTKFGWAVPVTACQNVSNEYKPMLSSGVYGADTEAKYQEYIAALEGAGINDIIAEYQRQLDEWLASQN